MTPPTSPEPDAALSAILQLRSLLRLSVIASLIVFSAVASHLAWQHRNVRREIRSQHFMLQEMDRQQRGLNEVAERFQKFGGSNADFVPILRKVGLEPIPPSGSRDTNAATATRR